MFRLPLYTLLILMATTVGYGQRSVGLLRTGIEPLPTVAVRLPEAGISERFTLARNLIFFRASVDGHSGSYILDTGAPSLILNDRGRADLPESDLEGIGAGGRVRLTDHHVKRFEMGGRAVRDYRAVGIDLRSMENRTDRRIDGFVGYDLINEGELRIDYARERFDLLPSRRRPLHEGREPRVVLRFELIDHLPVVRLRINGKRYAFALDTGAGINLVDHKLCERGLTLATGEVINVEGLDGRPADRAVVVLPTPDGLPDRRQELTLVSYDLSPLQLPGSPRLSGILGSAFLRDYTVGIDYRRRRVYLW
jgi:hypothetical protein